MEKITFAITGAFNEHKLAREQILNLLSSYNIRVVVSETVLDYSKELVDELEKITVNTSYNKLKKADVLKEVNTSSMLVIAPCTGNTMSKIANAISDNTVTMLAKAHMRNNKPIVLAISTNDGLGLNMYNLARLMNTKNIYFVPFKQDDFKNKPKSLMSDFNLIEQTVKQAEKNIQHQPVLL